ncbi:MAG: hypothetical protein ACRC3Y_16700 [Romboutsia sp.]
MIDNIAKKPNNNAINLSAIKFVGKLVTLIKVTNRDHILKK